jgi:formylglycine-generating enzyme required for sulfatase activity
MALAAGLGADAMPIVNAVDESPRTVCEASLEIVASGSLRWTIEIGAARPDPGRAGEAVDTIARCQLEEARSGKATTLEPVGDPVLIAELSVVASLLERRDVLSTAVEVTVRKLAELDEQGAPVYRTSAHSRKLFFAEDGDALVPLWVAADDEAPELHEVFLRITANEVVDAEHSLYGAILVVPGAIEGELLLDGGLAGRISAGRESVLRNIPVGLHELSARHDSGRELEVVRVEARRTAVVDFADREPATGGAGYHLEALGPNASGFAEHRRRMDGAVVVKVPSGEFLMGNHETERTPLEHPVYVSDFLMDKTGVTWRQYKAFAAATGTPLPPREPYWGIHDDHPVVYVSWEEADGYCAWVGGRLPTEAEREKAARGTDGRKYPWGDEEPDPERAAFRRSWGHEATSPVGSYPTGASPYGLLEMGGNLWEWCSDWYDADYYQVSPYRDPRGPESGIGHVVRGGSWDSRPSVLSASCRNWGYIHSRASRREEEPGFPYLPALACAAPCFLPQVLRKGPK